MTEKMRFSAGGEQVREALSAAFVWAERCYILSDPPTSGDDFWAEVGRHAERVQALVMCDPQGGTAALRELGLSSRLRRFTDGGRRGDLVWFERGSQVRLFIAPDSLGSATVSGPGLWFWCEGARSELPADLVAFWDTVLATSELVSVEDLDVRSELPDASEPSYSRPILSVREVLGIRSPRDFSEFDPDAQERALWSALLGDGEVDIDCAVRLCAERLRAQGFLDYGALRQDGRVYAALEERLLAARRKSELFDRPRSGFVRAIQRNVDELTAEQWRDCVVRALEVGVRVDREQAVRLGFAQAQTAYGVEIQRLRSGGRADQALRSAINSCLRQGYLQREGAAYLIRVAADASPSLRGRVASREPALEAAAADLCAEAGNATAPVESTPSPPPAPEPPAEAAELPPSDTASPLECSLSELDLPTRTLTWAARHEIDTVRQLVAWPPEQFENERNVGRRTVRETRERVEAHLGCSWESAHLAERGGASPPERTPGEDDEHVDSATEALTVGGSTGWTALAAALTEEQRRILLVDVQLPTRMKNFVQSEGLEWVGQLIDLGHAVLSGRDNLGRKSLNDTIDALRDHFAELAAPQKHASFVESWQAQLAALETIPRIIMTRRSGVQGARETLEELGAMLGITRERVRQIEARVIERLQERSRFRRALEEQVSASMASARAVPLELLAQEPWWAGVDHHQAVLGYVISRIFEGELFLLEAPSGKRYLTRFAEDDLKRHLESAKARLSKLEYPVERSTLDQILLAESEPLDAVLFSEFEQAVTEFLHIDPARPNLVLGYGRYRHDEVLAFLNGQEQPVPIGWVEEHCGRGALPDEVLYFKRGVVGLKRHFPDFDGWTARLVPPTLEVMRERSPGRQWLVPEIHDVLRERGLVPDWLGHWHLASVLRLSGQVSYLGRLRVASNDVEQERVQYEDLLEQLLEDAGGPLDCDELLSRARERTDIPAASASALVLQAPFVCLDNQRVGLVERDIPGGPEAVARAIEAVLARLTETEQGLTPHQAALLVSGLSEVHASWTRELVTSVLHNEPGIRIDRTQNIGLDDWDDVRCPARPEFVRREVQRAGGRVALTELNSRLEAFYGRAPDRGTLGVIAREVGLTIERDEVRRPPSITPEPLVDRAAVALAGVPTELREMFEELALEPLGDPSALRPQIDEHVAALEREHQVNEFVEVEAAHELARQCHGLLDRWHTFEPADRHLAHAAIRYFVSWHDLEHDLDIGGLDDDKQLMNAVLSHLGLAEVPHVARAS